jgi:uncharacterized XkdX family phage protein|nr:MAG TPA: hypothetical protein [Caudoviricetes sp.]
MYDMIKKYYDLGIYHKEDLIIFTKAGYITESQYNEIISGN